MVGHKERGTWGRLRQPWRLDAAAARSGARWWLRREEGDDLPGWASWAGRQDGGRVAAWADRPDEGNGGRVAVWAERPNRPAGRWAEWAESEGKFFSE
jgi:hypothetical protein